MEQKKDSKQGHNRPQCGHCRYWRDYEGSNYGWCPVIPFGSFKDSTVCSDYDGLIL